MSHNKFSSACLQYVVWMCSLLFIFFFVLVSRLNCYICDCIYSFDITMCPWCAISALSSIFSLRITLCFVVAAFYVKVTWIKQYFTIYVAVLDFLSGSKQVGMSSCPAMISYNALLLGIVLIYCPCFSLSHKYSTDDSLYLNVGQLSESTIVLATIALTFIHSFIQSSGEQNLIF